MWTGCAFVAGSIVVYCVLLCVHHTLRQSHVTGCYFVLPVAFVQPCGFSAAAAKCLPNIWKSIKLMSRNLANCQNRFGK